MTRTQTAIGYVRCPSCEQVSVMAAGYMALALCEHCGGALPQRRRVVTIARQVTPQGEPPPLTPVQRPARPDAR